MAVTQCKDEQITCVTSTKGLLNISGFHCIALYRLNSCSS